jgi:hypothetical protein
MRHHDASNTNEIINITTRREYLESDEVAIIVHNLRSNQNAEIRIFLKDITNDESVLSENLRRALSGLDGLAAITQPFAAADSIESRIELKNRLNEAITELSREVDLLTQNSVALDYLASQTNPVLTIKQTTDKAGAYHSKIVNTAKKIDGPKKASYLLTVTSTPAPASNAPAPAPDTFTYRVNKLYRLFPMAGLNYSVTQFNDVAYDAEHKTFTNTTQSHARFVIGMKVFLRKTDIRNTKFLTQKDENGRTLFLSRTSVTVAFDAAKPKDNFYTGFGWDLWPGFCLNTGVVFNRYAYNQYTDGVNIKSQTLYRPGIYLGVSTDVSLFTDIVKLLNLSK